MRKRFACVTTRNNQRMFRAAWSILKHRADAEDAVQTAYLRAFAAIEGFEGRSSLSTWLTRIVINEALGRKRAANRRRAQLDGSSVTVLDDYREKLMRGSTSGTSPETEVARMQVRRLLEDAISALPAGFRLVFVLREIEGMTVEATAEALGLKPGNRQDASLARPPPSPGGPRARASGRRSPTPSPLPAAIARH